MEVQVGLPSVSVVFFLLILPDSSAQGRLLGISKPDRHDIAASARWLVARNSWGVLSTISSELEGAPFGNVVSFSDGLPEEGSGIPYFYLTALDPTARNALKDPKASLTLSEYPVGTCTADPMDPSCAKLTLTGTLLQLDQQSKEAGFAQKALFTKHPEMIDWPEDHDFRIFKLDINDIFLINWYGGAKPITVDEYLHPKLIKLASAA